jgi:hypothetical protein
VCLTSQDLVIFVMDSSIGQAAHDQAAAFRESVDVSCKPNGLAVLLSANANVDSPAHACGLLLYAAADAPAVGYGKVL